MQQIGTIIFPPSSEESDDDSEMLELTVCVTDRKNVPRMENYVETVVPLFGDGQFKISNHILGTYQIIWSLNIVTFEYKLYIVINNYLNTTLKLKF